MICPACDEDIWIENLHDPEPFLCEECGPWIELVLDESTYEVAVKRHLQIVDDRDLD